MTKYITFNAAGVLSARYDTSINTVIPNTAIEVSDDLFYQTIDETDGIWIIDKKGKIKKHPFPPPTEKEIVLTEIANLEAQVTPRRQREAVLGIDNGWMADIDSRIANLRAKLSEPKTTAE